MREACAGCGLKRACPGLVWCQRCLADMPGNLYAWWRAERRKRERNRANCEGQARGVIAEHLAVLREVES